MSLRNTMALALLLISCVQSARADAVTEDDVKLALVYKIARFVSWPPSSIGDEFRLCLVGEQAYRVAERRLKGRRIRDRDIRVSLIGGRSAAEPAGCDIVYITRAEKNRTNQLVERFSSQPVLMIGDVPRFAEDGGMVGLRFNESRIGMTINVAAYERVGLVISSQLLELAEVIDGERRVAK